MADFHFSTDCTFKEILLYPNMSRISYMKKYDENQLGQRSPQQ